MLFKDCNDGVAERRRTDYDVDAAEITDCTSMTTSESRKGIFSIRDLP